MAHLLH
jgi:hypothetical protein